MVMVVAAVAMMAVVAVPVVVVVVVVVVVTAAESEGRSYPLSERTQPPSRRRLCATLKRGLTRRRPSLLPPRQALLGLAVVVAVLQGAGVLLEAWRGRKPALTDGEGGVIAEAAAAAGVGAVPGGTSMVYA